MRRLICIAMVLYVAGVCGAADSAVVGEWVASQEGTEIRLSFTAPGQVTRVIRQGGMVTERVAGRYSWDGKTLVVTPYDEEETYRLPCTIAGDTLTLTEDGAARDLLRCP